MGGWAVRSSWRSWGGTFGRVVAVPDPVGHRGPAPGDPGTNRPDRDVECDRDLRVVEPDEIAEGYGGPVVGRDRREGGIDVESSVDRSGRVDAGRHVGQVFGRDRTPAAATAFVERGVGGDAVH